MAITWDVQITPMSIPNKTCSVIATRTDSADPDNPMVYRVAKAPIDTGAQKTAVMQEIWDKHTAAVTKQTAIDTFLGSLEADAKSNLEARE